MTPAELRDSANTSDTPPEGVSPPVTALWWIANGDFAMGDSWHKAHEIAQSAEGQPHHDWVHAILHRIEGDESNAGYWYRRAGKPHSKAAVEQEWAEAAEAMLATPGGA